MYKCVALKKIMNEFTRVCEFQLAQLIKYMIVE